MMNKKIKLFLALIIAITIGVSIFVYCQKLKQISLDNNVPTVSEKSIAGTYIGHLANDVYVLTILSEQGESFTGTLDIKNFEKDSSTGTLKGTYKNEILLADYTFQSEGTESVGWIAFKKVADGFIRGFGNVDPETKTQFIDPNLLTFDSSVVYKLSNTIVNSVVFNCAVDKNIKAIFYKDRVYVSLSDGRKMSLPQVLSGSGARYANFDESFVFWNKGDTAFVNEGDKMTYKDCLISPAVSDNNSNLNSLANPASVNCSKVGGSLTIEKNGTGGEYGLCYFEDNRACEEWALMRGECPVGGVKTTGFDTVDQKYCAWSGGQTLAVPNSICTFKNGSKCSTVDFYNGKCEITPTLPVACMADAKQCPDGSYVGRSGPNCEFICPQ